MSTTIVDGHLHVFDRADRAERGIDELVPLERTATADALEAVLAAAGVSAAVLVPIDEQDEPVRSACARRGWALAGVAVASASDQGRTGVDAVRALRERHERYPFRALRTTWLGDPTRPIEDSPMRPVLQWLSDQDIALWSYVPPEQTHLLDALGTSFPDLPVVLNHLGFAPQGMRVDDHARPRFVAPFPAPEVERVVRLASHRRYHLMFSGHYALSAVSYPYPDLHAAGERLVDAFGTDRVLWGSDWPWVNEVPGYAQTLAVVDHALPGLSSTERAELLGGTVTRLLT